MSDQAAAALLLLPPIPVAALIVVALDRAIAWVYGGTDALEEVAHG